MSNLCWKLNDGNVNSCPGVVGSFDTIQHGIINNLMRMGLAVVLVYFSGLCIEGSTVRLLPSRLLTNGIHRAPCRCLCSYICIKLQGKLSIAGTINILVIPNSTVL